MLVPSRALPLASNGHVTTRSMSPQHLLSPMLTFATKKLWTDKRRTQLPSQLGPARLLFAEPFEKKVGKYISPPKF